MTSARDGFVIVERCGSDSKSDCLADGAASGGPAHGCFGQAGRGPDLAVSFIFSTDIQGYGEVDLDHFPLRALAIASCPYKSIAKSSAATATCGETEWETCTG
jgi:hypothetical protein